MNYTMTVFVRNIEVAAQIGVHKHEQGLAQPVRVNVEMQTKIANVADRLENVVNYEMVTNGINEIIGAGHINLTETLAERIATLCLKDKRVVSVRVRVEKLRALAGAESAGVEILRP